VEAFSQSAHHAEFPDRVPVNDAFLRALAYVERARLTVIWIDDPGGFFPAGQAARPRRWAIKKPGAVPGEVRQEQMMRVSSYDPLGLSPMRRNVAHGKQGVSRET
jgi:hypothetical protein